MKSPQCRLCGADQHGSVTGGTKQERWKKRNAEKYKAHRREYMKAYRQRRG